MVEQVVSPNAERIVKRVLLSWSSGKDSAWALHLLRKLPDVQVVALVTSFNKSADRVAMHAVRRALVKTQAERVRLPIWPVELPAPCSNAAYEQLMDAIWKRAVAEQVTEVAFGDLFLQDIRAYRERQLQGTGLTPIFPVWQLPTAALAREMIQAGVKAMVTCIDPAKLDRSFASRTFDDAFLKSLPPNVDPCGENGEFHTFVYDSPVFSSAIAIKPGEIVERDGFVFADAVPDGVSSSRSGLCATCSNAEPITSDRGSVFVRCSLSDKNPAFPRYPRLPKFTCPGYAA
jgi:uncharacterized protein (TIGR00290 family)